MFWKAVRGAAAAWLSGLPASIASWTGLVTPLACTFLREASAVATSPSCRSRGMLSAYRRNQSHTFLNSLFQNIIYQNKDFMQFLPRCKVPLQTKII